MRRSARRLAWPLARAAVTLLAATLGSCTLGRGAPERLPPERRVTRPALGTLVEVVVREADGAHTRRAIEASFAEIERLEALLSEWREGSEISALNRASGRGWVPLSPETAEALRQARALARETGGAFDPTVLPFLRLWGFAGGVPRVPGASEVAQVLGRVGWQHLEVDARAPRARLSIPGAQVGLGGIGKGFIAERVLRVLSREGIGAALVAAAGDLAFYGGTEDRPWQIGIEDPQRPGREMARLERLEGAVSTSAPTYRFFEAHGRRFHHLIDPRTGRPAQGLRSATVLAADAARADALATALFVMGKEARAHVRAHPEIEAILLFEDGQRWVSPGLSVSWLGDQDSSNARGGPRQISNRQIPTKKSNTP